MKRKEFHILRQSWNGLKIYNKEYLKKEFDLDIAFAAYDRLLAEAEALRKQLAFYAAYKTWSPELFLCLLKSDDTLNDLQETSYSRYTPGKGAREAIERFDKFLKQEGEG